MITYRTMTMDDIPGGLLLCRANRWNQVARDWEIFLRLSPDNCLVATSQANISNQVIIGSQTTITSQATIAGTVTTLRYQRFFSWIGMVLVDPSFQRQGIGMQLLQQAMEISGEDKTIKLDATPAGREVYLKLGFVDEYPLSRMHAEAVTGIWQNDKTRLLQNTRPMQNNDLSAIARFDREIFGANRRPLLEWIRMGAPQYAFLVEEGHRIQGYCLGRRGHNFIQIGPVVANDIAIAQDLVTAALANCTGQPVILDIPHHDPNWSAWVNSLGFSVQRPFMRMFRGLNTFNCIPELQFAITGPEFG